MWILLTSALLLASNNSTSTPSTNQAEASVKKGVQTLKVVGGLGKHVCVVPAPSKRTEEAIEPLWPSIARGESEEAAEAAAKEECKLHHSEQVCSEAECVYSNIDKTTLESTKRSDSITPPNEKPKALFTHRIGNPTLDFYAHYIEAGGRQLHIAHASTLIEAQVLALQNCLSLKEVASKTKCKLVELGNQYQMNQGELKRPGSLFKKIKIKIQKN